MKNTILQHNMFLQNMAIIPIINIKDNEKNKSRNFLNRLFTFRVSKPQKISEGMYLLITNKSVITKAQKEADNLLIKFCGHRQNTSN